MKKKTFGAVLLLAIMALAATLALTGCSKDKHEPDNSFEGSVSAQSYNTVDNAAKAFIDVELDGKATSATFVSYEKDSDLTAEEIAELNLGEDFEYTVDQIDSAENGVVSYSDSYSRSANAVKTSADSDVKTARVIIIKIGSVYWYYVPLFRDGDVLTNSYMDNILDFTKYRNVTETVVSKSSAKLGFLNITSTVTVTTKIAGDKVHFKQVSTAFGGEKETTEYYFIFSQSGSKVYEYSESKGWYSKYTTAYNTVDGFLEQAFKYDASYFVKTKSGFKMNAEKLNQYLDDVFTGVSLDGYSITGATADYYVKDAKLDSAQVKITMNMTVEGQTVKATANATTTYSNFGTTEINLPFEI